MDRSGRLQLFRELKIVSFCNAVIPDLQRDFIHINDTKNNFVRQMQRHITLI